MKIKLLWPLAALLVCVATPVAGQPASQPDAAEAIPAAAIRADFADLDRGLRSGHFDLYARISRASFDRLYRRELAAIRGAETPLEVARRFQRFVAAGRVAHARIDYVYQAYAAWRANGGRAFPLTLRIVDGRAFVVENLSGLDAIGIGDEVTAIDGRPIGEWLARCRRNLSADNAYMADALMELDLPMLLWLELGERPSFAVQVARTTRTISARTRDEMAAARRTRPPRLDLSGRNARLLAPRLAYLRPGPFYNAEAASTAPYDNAAFRRFIDEAFESFLAAGPDTLLIDLRDNPGGDSAFSDIMIGWFADRPFRFASSYRIRVSPEAIASNRRRLEAAGGDPTGVSQRYADLYATASPGTAVAFEMAPGRPRGGRRFSGRVYVLVNRNSYSNAVAVAATIQDYRFGTIIGEETSDLATTYGAMESFTLPRTHLVVGFPKARIVRPSGDLTPRGVVPDIAIATPLREGPDDPVLSEAVALTRARRP